MKVIILNILLVAVISLFTGCSEDSGSSSSSSSTSTTSSVGETINYRQLAANHHSVNVNALTDAQLISFFNQFFVTTSQTISDSFNCTDSTYFKYGRNGSSAYTSGSGSYSANYTGVSLSIDGDYLAISAQGMPDHKSYFYYNAETSPVCTFSMGNPINNIDIEMKIPLNPTVASNSSNTTMSTIGLAKNGVSFFDGYASNTNNVWSLASDAYDQESGTFDQMLGHPQQTGTYHYHVDPTYSGSIDASSPIFYTTITAAINDRSALLGFMRDGFPIYGPQESGTLVSESSLDSCRGHVGTTSEFGAVYHYHVKALENITANTEDAYIIGCFSGTVGPAVTSN